MLKFIKERISTVLLTLILVLLASEHTGQDSARNAAVRVVDSLSELLKSDGNDKGWSGSFSYQLNRTTTAPAYGYDEVQYPRRLSDDEGEVFVDVTEAATEPEIQPHETYINPLPVKGVRLGVYNKNNNPFRFRDY